MSKCRIVEVNNRTLSKMFLDLPRKIYKESSSWVCPLDSDIEKVFDAQKNKMFQEGEAIRYVAIDNFTSQCVGRIAAFYNKTTSAQQDSQGALVVGGCGFFECENNFESAKMLFDGAKKWLISKGCEAMDGPINFGDREMWWGLLTEGFTQPVYGMNFNHPYYQQLFEQYGFKNFFNGISYGRKLIADDLNPIVVEKARRIKEIPDFKISYIPKKNLPTMAKAFADIYKSAWSKFEGIAEITEGQALAIIKNMMPIVDEKLIYFAFHKDEPIGFFISVPDLNGLIKDFNGKMGIINTLKLLYRLRISKKHRVAQGLIFAVKSQFQGKGLESAIINCCSEMIEKGLLNYDFIELTWIGDFNPLMMRMVESYVGGKKVKNHATYRLLFDENRPFERCKKVSVARTK